MAKSDEELDRVFREKLENYKESLRLVAWDKLEAQLDTATRPKKNFWWAIAASMPLLLGLGYLIWSQAPQSEPGSPLAAIEEVSTSTPVSESSPEVELVVSEVDQKPVDLAETNTLSKSTTAQKSILPQENSEEFNLKNVVAETVTLPIPQGTTEATGNSASEPKIWVSPEPTKTSSSPTIAQVSSADGADLDGYRIQIFSNGLNKEEGNNKNLITALGKTVGQVEGILETLDVGILEIQDKKVRFFSSLTSRKTTTDKK